MTPPIVVDIDGTITRGDGSSAVDHRAFEELRAWPAPVVIATGKAFPYPVALCQFVGIEPLVIAENGGIVLAGGEVRVTGDASGPREAAREYREAGYELGWGETDLVNRWRETEVALSRESPLAPLEEIAAEYGLEVVDTGYAYHLKDPAISKGAGLEAVCDALGRTPEEFVAIGDSENDVSTFEVAGRSFAVANADGAARAAADEVLEGRYSAGTVSVLSSLR
ncbi:phosphoglycolate phosphatase [Halalkalicoccus jeotgali]|uniref:Phosphoglycolate phosphatase n=1 Tax=Halalkalicoccus jeotgali (strain DSM 18796 / CECT 7217 / JCM 14584 / KCTC 4019 / B3) TaxID=795797 RepID=D8J4Q7_HALJB|nr:phosphoglycolate phosphatase [Halalkalicoccus jeotgali]ADJ15524.1 SPP-like hydrolase [Halalkalicoccus jeotgali B3]ELY36067.1 SPP-like hydrolase [Halalkalicoccus jeotgali B3]